MKGIVILGFPKCGTTSLMPYLAKKRGISVARDAGFYSGETKPVVQRREWSYLPFEEQLKRFKHEFGDPKDYHLAFITRDPIERLFSNYLMQLRNSRLKLSFHDEIQRSFKKKNDKKPFVRLESSLYFENVKRYLDIFGSKQVKILIFEKWIKDSRHTLEEILNFLDLNYKINEFEEESHNPYVVPRGSLGKSLLSSSLIRKISQKTMSPSKQTSLRKLIVKKQSRPTIDANDKKALIKYYKDDVKKLENFLGQKLPWKNFG